MHGTDFRDQGSGVAISKRSFEGGWRLCRPALPPCGTAWEEMRSDYV